MKQNILKTLMLITILLANSYAFAHDFEVNGIFYKITSLDNNLVGVYYKGTTDSQYKNEYTDSVNIPDSVTYNNQTYYVTSIESSAFYACENLTSVIIPESITRIGDSAFLNCYNLSNITITTNSTTSVGDRAFENTSWYNNQPIGPVYLNNICIGCKGYKPSGSLTLKDNTVSIADNAFKDCTDLIEVIIPNNLISIGEDCFKGCTRLNNIIFNNNIRKINDRAFENCTNLTSITLPKSIEIIGFDAFYGCSNLVNITLPNTIKSFGKSAFEQTKWYKTQPKGIIYLGDYCLGYKDTKPSGELTLKDNTILIADQSFFDCKGLTTVNIPNSVTIIDNSVFYGCTSLIKIDIPNSVTSIGESAFYNCSSLTNITIPNSIRSIKNSTFANCVNLASITIPNSVTSIELYAFSYCKKLVSITLPNSVTSIGSYAFWNCSNLNSITISNSINKILYNAFGNCEKITEIYCKAKTPPTCISRINVNYDFFSDKTYKYTTLYIHKGCKDIYASTEPWSYFTHIKETDFTGVESTLADDINISVENGNIVINGVDEMENVEVYNVNGQCIYSGTNTTIPVTTKGLYIVKVNGKSFKVIL